MMTTTGHDPIEREFITLFRELLVRNPERAIAFVAELRERALSTSRETNVEVQP